ncbi:alginate O-acetyltransferase AlgX-related protein [Pseudomonas sp.]|uniref:alginate O-acetyltransferase AlgX-related protein n=1 Tax=Pseudomonas sp. TaxID=306 RepID=UPI0028A7C61D|nr:cell division protein FtsQ [Pseudomonas sp.]
MSKSDPSLRPTLPSPLTTRLSPLAGLSLVAFMAVGLFACLWAIGTGRVDPWPEHLDWRALRNGDITHHIAHELTHVPVAQTAADVERALSWLALGDTGARVRSGCPSWLFLSDELLIHPHSAGNAQAHAAKVVAVRDWLASRGIRLLVVTIPDKSRIAADQLCGLPRAARLATRLDDWDAQLRASGVATLNPVGTLQALGSDAFLRTDTHWSERGAQATAQRLGEQVLALGVRPSPPQGMTRTTLPTARRPGDLIRLAGLDWLPERLQPAGERVATTHLAPRAEASGDGEDDLFGDGHLPNIALIGTSFSRNGNFVPFLEEALHAPVGNFAKDGGAFSGAARAYFDSEAFRQTPPQLLIWEVNERDVDKLFVDDLPLP